MTLLIVAMSLVAVVAMAALAIDVASLYTARGEAQRAANAAALAGAEMFVRTSFTSRQSAWDPADICANGAAGGTAAANVAAEKAAQQNLIAGQAAAIRSVTCTNINANQDNPQITVTVERANLPTFFARIWGGTATTVAATATAEAYNPTTGGPEVQISGVKPWLVPNCDPTHTTSALNPPNPNCGGSRPNFINPDGTIANNGAFVGQTFCFSRLGQPNSPFDNLNPSPDPNACGGLPVLRFYSLQMSFTLATSACPSALSPGCDGVGSDPLVSNIACTTATQFSCSGTNIQGGGSGSTLAPHLEQAYGVAAQSGAQCLIHANGIGLGQGQDIFTPTGGNGVPVLIDGSDNNPNLNLQNNPNISRSDSIATVALYDGRNLCPGGSIGGSCPAGPNVQPVGFMQIGITAAMDLPYHFQAVVLNVTGCGAGVPIQAESTSPIPVRLIHP